MKKLTLIIVVLLTTLLTGCSSTSENKNQIKPNTSSTDKNEKNTKINKKSNSMQKISDINILGTIKNGNKVAYTLEVTKVIDVTEEAKNQSINDSNYLDFYSSNQAKQAVSITIKISNSSGKTISAPFLDDIKIKDSAGITNVGGWKNENSSSTEFGTYQLDNEYKTKKENYEVENDETKLVTSTVLLATPSERINFIFTSELYNDEIQFDLPVSKQ
jgi:outer membrane murein-binding lipoprotein Lpp